MTSLNRQELLDRVYDQFDDSIRRVEGLQDDYWLTYDNFEKDGGLDFPPDDPIWRYLVNYYSFEDIAKGIERKLRENKDSVDMHEEYIDDANLLNIYEGLQDISVIAEELSFWDDPDDDKIDDFLSMYKLLGYIQLLLRLMREIIDLSVDHGEYKKALEYYERQRDAIKEYINLEFTDDFGERLLGNRRNFMN